MSSAHLVHAGGVASDVDQAVEMRGVAHEPRELEVDQTQADLGGGDLRTDDSL